jgi:hypothetical protein
MNILKFLEEFTNDSMMSQTSSRRDVFGTFGSLSKKFALASVPFGLATASTTSYGATAAAAGDPVGALQFALTLEYLEDEFYDLALQSGVITNNSIESVIMKISQHEQAHVTYLKNGLTAAGVTPVSKPTFDFTAGGLFDPFNSANPSANAQLMALAQAFEDTGVRAYKGQATNLLGSPFLTAALQIHSVEARHASEIRRIRGLKGWITGKERGTGMPAQTQAVYDGEENLTQGGINVTTLGTGPIFGVSSSTEAYDEPLSKDAVLAIAGLFIVS